MQYRKQKFIAELLYEQERIKTQYRQRNFIAELFPERERIFFTKEGESEYANKKQKDAKNEVACDVTNYFNVSNLFGCGRNNHDVSYERACMATEDIEYFTDILDTLNEYQDRHGQRFSNKSLALLR